MKYYQQLAMMPSFTFFDAAKVVGSEISAPKILNLMIKDGMIHRIRRDLYTCVNFSTGDDFANRFQIASKITDDSFVSFHSAFEFYGFYNQSYYEMQVCSKKRFAEFEYGDYQYKSFTTNSCEQVDIVQGVRVTSIERTIVDSINMLGKVMDAEELVKCLDLIHLVNENKILGILSIYNKEILYRKVGYVLSFFKSEFSLSDNFFDVCKQKGVLSNKGSLITKENGLTFIGEWGIYAYENLRKLTYKGGEEDV